MNIAKILFTFLAVGTLAGCAGVNGKFSCPKVGGKGVGCASMEQVNQMANQGDFNQSGGVAGDSKDNTTVAGKLTGFRGLTPSSGMPLRFGETVQNVWIAPYTDKQNNYHWAQMVTVIVAPGHWVGSPVSSIQDSGEN